MALRGGLLWTHAPRGCVRVCVLACVRAEASLAKVAADVAKAAKAVEDTRVAFEAAEREEADRRKQLDVAELEIKKLTKARDAARKVQ